MNLYKKSIANNIFLEKYFGVQIIYNKLSIGEKEIEHRIMYISGSFAQQIKLEPNYNINLKT